MECSDFDSQPPPDGILQIPPPPPPPEPKFYELCEKLEEDRRISMYALESNPGFTMYADHWYIILIVILVVIVLVLIIVFLKRRKQEQQTRQDETSTIPLRDMSSGGPSCSVDT